jgi:hypothetical protein
MVFRGFRPTVAAILGDEFADGQFRGHARPGAAFAPGQGVFRLDRSLSDVAGARLRQFNRSPQTGPVFGEQNADFIVLSVPLSALGPLANDRRVHLAAVVVNAATNETGQTVLSVDTGFLGNSLRSIDGGGTELSPWTVQLTSGIDTDDDGLPDDRELLLATDPTKPDTDADGLPDGWEVRHRLNPLRGDGESGGSADPDDDSMSNLAEWKAGTDPRDARSKLQLEIERTSPDRLRLRWLAVLGRRYALEVAEHPLQPFHPVDSQAFPRVARGPFESHDVELPTDSGRTRYYRLRIEF